MRAAAWLAAATLAVSCAGGETGAATTVSLPVRTTVGAAATTTAATTTAATTTTATTTTTMAAPTTTVPAVVHRAFPVQDAGPAGFADTHHDYPAADVFHPGGCGTTLVAPVDGVVLEANPVDHWSAAVDDPATRGGIFLSILGNDGVRYYMAHFRALADGMVAGAPVTAGQVVGEMGETGRAGACHLHFALSPPCATGEWWVRRGVIWPQPYLRDWQAGGQASPVDEIARWVADHPGACDGPPPAV